jgi:hypothetical protein
MEISKLPNLKGFRFFDDFYLYLMGMALAGMLTSPLADVAGPSGWPGMGSGVPSSALASASLGGFSLGMSTSHQRA